jgi:hypothetical protein
MENVQKAIHRPAVKGKTAQNKAPDESGALSYLLTSS